MVVITAVFTAVVATVQAWTRDGIQTNQRLREVRGAFDVLGVDYAEARSADALMRLAEQRLKPETREGLTFYRGFDSQGRHIGYVFPTGGAGFWGPIRGYVAVDSEIKTITGIGFVGHSETPGLGARITEDWFRKQFVGKPIAPPKGRAIAFRLVQEGKPKTGPQDVDAITGATGTSTGVERFLNRDLATIRRLMKPDPAAR